MQSTDNIVRLDNARRASNQEIIDDIGARAFLFIRDAAEEMDIPIKDVIIEHMRGMAMVMGAVEGEAEAQSVLQDISLQLSIS